MEQTSSHGPDYWFSPVSPPPGAMTQQAWSSPPPPPPPPGAPPPQPEWGAPTPPLPAPNQYQFVHPVASPAPPRPAVPVAAGLMLSGAAVVVVGCVLNWLTLPEGWDALGIPRRWNGYTKVLGEYKDGPFFTAMAVIVAGFGITSLAAKRLLPIMIIGVVVAAFGLVAASIDLADISNPEGVPAALEPDVGPGLPVAIVGFLLAVAGFVAGLAKRRRAGVATS